MRLVVTRPTADAAPVVAALEARGHAVLAEPLLSIRWLRDAEIADRPYAAVLVTSANAVRGLVACGAAARLRSVPVHAVGRASAEAAAAAGFDMVDAADGDLAALGRLVRAAHRPGGAPLLYAAGRTVSGDLQGLLEAAGYAVDRVVVYEAEAATRLSAGLAEALTGHALDGVLLFSPRTARLWAELSAAAGLGEAARRVRPYCLSRAVADALGALGGPHCAIAAIPDTHALLALVDAA
jgi:uroporphyrinogen-III synthase